MRPAVEAEGTDRERGRLGRVRERPRLKAADGPQVGEEVLEGGRVAQASGEIEQGSLAETEEPEPFTLQDKARGVAAGPRARRRGGRRQAWSS